MAAVVLTSTENMPYEKWLEWRKRGIGGSDASVVCGINKYKSPVELWMEKTGQSSLESTGAGCETTGTPLLVQGSREAAYWGTQLESLVKTEFTKRTGIEVVSVNKLLCNKAYPFQFANLDGVCKHPDLGPVVFEAKTASTFKADEWENAVPEEYVLQVQHYLSVTGYMGAYIAVLIGGNTFKWTFIARDEELISMLIRWEGDFWEHVQSDIPPALDGSAASATFLKKRFPRSVALSKIKLPNTAIELIHQYNEACEKNDVFIEQKQRAENLLKQMLGENEIGITDGHVVTWKTVNQERFDSKTLKSEHPALYKQYANPTAYRRFNIKTAS